MLLIAHIIELTNLISDLIVWFSLNALSQIQGKNSRFTYNLLFCFRADKTVCKSVNLF